MKQFLVRRWFLLSLTTLFLVGMFNWRSLLGVAEASQLRHGLVACVLFVMALPLQASAVGQTLARPWAPLLAIAVTFGILPLFAWLVSWGLNDEFAPGLLVAAATPCTLASAAVWTRRAGGNDAAALMVTVITNATCFVVTPLWLVTMTGQSVTISLPEMIGRLGVFVVLPMCLAQLLRLDGPVGRWTTRHKVGLGVVAQMGVLSMVFFGAIRTGMRIFGSGQGKLGLADVLLMIVATLTVHVVMFFLGMLLARLIRLSREDRIAVGFAGSQKTLMVGLQVAMDSHLSVLPMITYHVGQLFVDTLLADRLRQQGESTQQE